MTVPAWRGIYAAARAQGPVLALYEDFGAWRAQRLVELVAATPSLRTVVVHGIPPGSLRFARLLKARAPRVRIAFVFHGGIACMHGRDGDLVAELIEAARAGVVDKVGAVKAGMAEVFLALGAPRAAWTPNFPSLSPVLPMRRHSESDGRLHVGILNANQDVPKNIAVQLVAACGIDGAGVHVTAAPDPALMRHCNAELVVTGMLPHLDLLVELAQLDVLLFVSLSEAFPRRLCRRCRYERTRVIASPGRVRGTATACLCARCAGQGR